MVIGVTLRCGFSENYVLLNRPRWEPGRSGSGGKGLDGSDGGGGEAEEHDEGVPAVVGDPEVSGE